MKTKKQDLLLTLIDEGHSITLNQENLQIIDYLKKSGLIRESTENSFKLTPYGKLVRVTGYKSHLQTEEFEKELPKYTPGRARAFAMLLSVLFTLLIALLLIIIWIHPEG